jgi:hypothetical protein
MSEKLYQIVVTGELVDGTYLPVVKAKLAALFNSPAEKLDPLFSGKRLVIKKGLAEEAAQKYVTAVQNAGLRCIAEAMTMEAPRVPVGEMAAGMSVAPIGTTLIDPPAVTAPAIDISAYSVAPVGETLIEAPAAPVVEIDISAFSVAPVGGNLVEHIPPEAPSIDTSALSVAPPGTQLAEPTIVAQPAINIGALDLAPVGSDMGQAKSEDAPPPPDTRHLTLD